MRRGVALLLLLTGAAPIACPNPSTATCSASTHAQLAPAALSTEAQNALRKLLPQPTSERVAVRGELRAPFHIPCQLRAFPHLNAFVSEIQQLQLPNFEVKEFAQPPHLVFFDENQDVVSTVVVVVAPTWNGFDLWDLIRESLDS